MQLPLIIEKHYDQLVKLCQAFQVQRLYVFGSVVTDQFDYDNSDLDVIVELKEMPPLDKGLVLIELWENLEDLFNGKVDLLTDQTIKNPYLKKSIDSTKRLIYDRESEEILI